ncbi:UNVERIFIED_ORG: hypothetical protein ABIB19_002199 [Arthrobacter sp. UYEF10]
MENLQTAKTAHESALGTDKADVTQGQNLESAVSSLSSVKNISFIAFVAALGTAGLIILLIMVMLVRAPAPPPASSPPASQRCSAWPSSARWSLHCSRHASAPSKSCEENSHD